MKQYEKNLAGTQKLALGVLMWIRDFVPTVYSPCREYLIGVQLKKTKVKVNEVRWRIGCLRAVTTRETAGILFEF